MTQLISNEISLLDLHVNGWDIPEYFQRSIMNDCLLFILLSFIFYLLCYDIISSTGIHHVHKWTKTLFRWHSYRSVTHSHSYRCVTQFSHTKVQLTSLIQMCNTISFIRKFSHSHSYRSWISWRWQRTRWLRWKSTTTDSIIPLSFTNSCDRYSLRGPIKILYCSAFPLLRIVSTCGS